MGWDVSVLREGIDADLDIPIRAKPSLPAFPVLGAKELARGLASGAAIAYDLRSSTDYRAMHAAGTRWSISPFLLNIAPMAPCVVLISDAAGVAALSASGLRSEERRVGKACVRTGRARG